MSTSQLTGLRFHQVMGDTMVPTLRPRDYVLVAPATRYGTEGLYLLSDPIGDATVVFDCSGALGREEPAVRLRSHNKLYPDHFVSRAYFEEHVLAEVVMTCNIVRPDLIAVASRHLELEV